jgi:hypothetical protein
MRRIFEIFQELKYCSPQTDDRFLVTSIPLMKNHKIGITKIGQPIFFIKCYDTNIKSKIIDTNLEFISIQFNRNCQITNKNGSLEEDIFSIILLKTEVQYLQEYFIKTTLYLLKNLPKKPLLKDLKTEIDKLINLFSKFTTPPIKTIQGLWAELLIIEQSKNIDYLIKSWHITPSDKYDFNDGVDKIEVKSTTKNRRIHTFSLEQLAPNSKSNLIVSSVCIIETGVGKSIYDLIDKIELKIKDKNLIYRINEIVATTLGKDFEKSFDIFFDYKYAIDSVQHYNILDIPTIDITNIPKNIMNVKFDCDLTDVKPINQIEINSKLHEFLIF